MRLSRISKPCRWWNDLLFAHPHHGAAVRTVGRPAQRHLIDDRGAVDEPAHCAHVCPGRGGVVEDREYLAFSADELIHHLVARGAEGLCRRVQVEPVAGLVLHLRHQDRFALEARGAGDPVALRLHADDLGVRVLGDLPDEGLAVGIRHPVAGLDALLVGDEFVEETLLIGDLAHQGQVCGTGHRRLLGIRPSLLTDR